MLTELLTLLFPDRCAACDAAGVAPFCEDCEGEVVCGPAAFASGFAHSTAVWEYSEPVARALHRFKYQGRLDIGRVLAAALAERLTAIPFDVVVPIPLHRSRFVERGFNQAFELARRIPAPTIHALRRDGAERPAQVGLGRRARMQNLVHAFTAVGERVAGQRVLLVDDVMTTGATADAARFALESAGARTLAFACVARQSTPSGAARA